MLALIVRPSLLRAGISPALDWALLAVLAVIALQVLPLPSSITALLSPHSSVLRQQLALIPETAGWLPLTIDQRASLWAGAIVAGTVALYFTARTIVAAGGLRHTVRGISMLGFVFSALGLAQAATAGRSIYWRFPTEYEGPLPFGPFVNRNHFATWVIMAIPMCVGYMLARTGTTERSTDRFVSRRTRVARIADGRMIWLAAATAMMLAALLASMSRSGIVGLLGAVAFCAVAQRKRPTVRRAWWVVAVCALVVGFAVTRADIPALTERFSQSGVGVRERVTIWRETVPIVKDFWLTGTGVGTYRIAMLAYQHTDRNVQFNQAHNHYLQVASEGGLVLLIPVAAVLIALIYRIKKQLEIESSGAYWIRAGASCGLLAVALQSLWDVGLVMPANSALAASLAAIASYER